MAEVVLGVETFQPAFVTPNRTFDFGRQAFGHWVHNGGHTTIVDFRSAPVRITFHSAGYRCNAVRSAGGDETVPSAEN